MDISVLLVEDDATIRNGIAYLIDNTDGFNVIGKYSSYNESAKHLIRLSPDVILLDIELPGINGIDAILEIRKKLPTSRIIILTVYDNEQTIFRAFSNGASGYLTKNMPGSKITDAILEVINGGAPMSPGIAKLVIQSFQKNLDSPLTKRETEVLENIATGKGRTKIANDLFIDLETVKTHIKNIYLKLNVNTKEEALRIAKKNKFI
ncbi:MAG: response regulator transcription factor [Saprospiraceae bacterium]|nr:response regulator transcription factor [Saprospiraceae bacterium]